METLLHVGRGCLGIAVFLGFAAALSENRRAINWRLVATGIGLQFLFAAIVLYLPPARAAIEWVGARFVDLLGFTGEGVAMVGVPGPTVGSMEGSCRH